MYHQHSNNHRQGSSERGRYPSNTPNVNLANSTGARNASLPMVRPATASQSPPSRTVSGQGQGQAPVPPPQCSNPPIIRTTSAFQKPQYKPNTNDYAKQNYTNQRNNVKATGYEQRPSPPQTPPSYNNHSGSHNFHRQQPSLDKSLTRGNNSNWAYHQELRIKVLGLPRGCWTRNVYEDLSKYGKVVRIEMQAGSMDCNAWVTFQPRPSQDFWSHPVEIDHTRVRIEQLTPRLFFVPSPITPFKKYNEFNILHANSIDFGVRVANESLMIMRTANAVNRVQVMLNLKRKEIDIQFPFALDGEERNFRFRMPLSLLGHIDRITDLGSRQSTLIIPFESPPQFYIQAKAKSDIAITFRPSDKIWNDWNTWYRQTEVVNRTTRDNLKYEPLKHLKGAAIIDIGRWTTYRLSFDTSALTGPQFEEFSNALADYGVPIKDPTGYSLVQKIEPILWDSLQEEVTTHSELVSASDASAFADLSTSQVHINFSVRYQLEVCLSNGFLKEHKITRAFLEQLASMDPVEATYILEKVADRQKVRETVLYDPMNIFKVPIVGQLTKKVPSYCVLSRAVNITPTMMHVASPVVETSNRIIRKHATDADRFIRVKFSDEKTEGRISQGDDRSEPVFARIRRAMDEGIIVAGRFYEFLAFGNSQFRENGAFFYAPTSSVKADDIRLAMGNFDNIKTIAKFGARLGQCFSTTRSIHNVTVMVKKIPDIERNGFMFTDGVGKISRFLAQMAAQELGLQNPFDDPPSLYQFRLAGCKGVLAIDPGLMGTTVQIRPSQYKFEAPIKGLEIIRASAFATACFNRQLIIVLSTLGVPDQTFIRKQQEMVNYLERATREQNVALERLSRNIDFNGTTLTMVAMILDGFMKSKDPFMMSLLQLWRAYHIKFLKEKARIVIERGAFVLGCVDETAILRGHFNDPQSRPDATRDEKMSTLPEIFLQVSNPAKRGHYRVIEGICILARNPSLHGGDIRVVRAVDVPALHHMKNVVVLPQTGDRDVANMCSGGDLDGDDYLIMWDDDFIPQTINEFPMDFTPEKPTDLDRPITVSDLSEFFVTYMKNDSLARIALAHLAQADFNEEGVRDSKCLELAQLHSQAVDYPKSGLPAIMDHELKPKKWPHFMESKYRTENQIYKSKKILGMLYDQIKLVDFQPQYENAFDSRIMNAFELDEAILNEAVSLKESYDSSLKRTMAKHAIRTEFEAWSVFVLSHNQEGSDYTFVQDFGVVVQILKDSTRESCLAASSGHGGLARFVAAMYTITAREMEEALKECRIKKTVGGQEVPVRKMDPENMPLMSFPWVFYDQLGRIATGNRSDLEPIIIPHGVRKQQKKHVDLDFDFDPALTAEANGNIETSEGILHYGELLKLDFSPMGSGRSSSMDVETRNRTDRVVRGTPSESIQLSFQATTQHGSARDGGSYQTPLRSGSEKTEINEKEKRREVKVMLDHRPSAVTKQLEK